MGKNGSLKKLQVSGASLWGIRSRIPSLAQLWSKELRALDVDSGYLKNGI